MSKNHLKYHSIALFRTFFAEIIGTSFPKYYLVIMNEASADNTIAATNLSNSFVPTRIKRNFLKKYFSTRLKN